MNISAREKRHGGDGITRNIHICLRHLSSGIPVNAEFAARSSALASLGLQTSLTVIEFQHAVAGFRALLSFPPDAFTCPRCTRNPKYLVFDGTDLGPRVNKSTAGQIIAHLKLKPNQVCTDLPNQKNMIVAKVSGLRGGGGGGLEEVKDEAIYFNFVSIKHCFRCNLI